mgnify:CR=1 FL=1
MVTLHVRNVPGELMEQVREWARTQNRSISAEVVVLLERGLSERPMSVAEALADIRRMRFRPPAGAPTRLELLREDKER